MFGETLTITRVKLCQIGSHFVTFLHSNQEQYMFVHDAMLENLFCKDTFVSASVFANKVETLQLQNPDTGNTYLEDEFEVSWV